RRRHTRSLRDWSSDVCSSDLMEEHTSELQSSRRRHTRSLRDWSSDVCSSIGKSTRLNSSHVEISYAVFCLKKKMTIRGRRRRGPLLDPGKELFSGRSASFVSGHEVFRPVLVVPNVHHLFFF